MSKSAEKVNKKAKTAAAKPAVPKAKAAKPLANWEALAAEYLDGWQRARAELDNFRKRTQEEQSLRHVQAAQQAIEPLLELSYNFQAMIEHVPVELADHSWVQGVIHVARQLEDIIASYNVSPIEALNQPFDPQLHEAVEKVKHTKESSGQVVEVVRAGYVMGDRVIRPAQVKVAA